MQTNIAPSPIELLQGTVEHVTYHSEETGFCVLRVKVKGRRDLVSVTGNAATIAAGESVECEGSWENDRKHGLQFKTRQLSVVPPVTLDGIEKYLGSGMIKGVGPHFAKKLIEAFGERVFEVIETAPHRLTRLSGIGEYRKQQMVASWKEQKTIRKIMIFLQSHGVGTARAVRIYKVYGEQAVERVQENPYRLSLDIRGIGFKTADILATRLGVARDSILRAQAGVRHVLQELCDHGHCAAALDALIEASVKLLEIDEPIIKEALEEELKAKNLVADVIESKACIFPANLYQAELKVTQFLFQLRTGALPWGNIDAEKAIPWVEKKTNLILSDSQKQAIHTALKNKVVVITGGPGVGKTTLVNSLLNIIRAKQLNVSLAAPTGRAAKRLLETTGIIAKTIHRLLEFDPKSLRFRHQEEDPLDLDVLVIDEASMIDIRLFHQLLRAIPPHAALLLVGDVDQLPSVGSGAVLSDLIKSGAITTVRLTEIFRQAAHSKIIVNAHRINQGQMPLPNESTNSDFYTIYLETPEEIRDQLIQLVSSRLPKHCNCNPLTDIQVLTPMNRGGLGSGALNIALQEHLNGAAEPKIKRFGWTFAPGDKVIQNVNNYDKEVFNGDIGFITHINLEEENLNIRFDQRVVTYEFSEVDELSLAYAISIHKSQGSEFPIVVLPLAIQHYALLARNLLYTAVTRGKTLVVLLGQKKAVSIAVHNHREAQRLTKLSWRLGEGLIPG